MKPVHINFHSLVSVWAPRLTDVFRADLELQFRHFIQETGPEPPPHPDIVMTPMSDLPPATEDSSRLFALYGVSVLDYHGEVAVGLLHRGLPDVLVVSSDPLKIVYRPRAGNQSRLYWALLFGIQLSLRRKGALLVHGAVVEREGQTLWLAGHRGSRKTQMLLTLVRQGWNYLSDDKFILHNGMLYLFESRIRINDHLFSCLPWIRRMVPRTLLQQSATPLRNLVRPLAYRWLPKRPTLGLEKTLNPTVHQEIEVLMPSCRIRTQAEPTRSFLLFHGNTLSVREIPRQLAVTTLSSINRMLFSSMASMESMLVLYAGVDNEPLQNLFDRNLPDMPFHKVVVPEKSIPESVCQEILKCCEVQ